jgi:pimeloyl-ACP methyl ester carboxylesterase
MGNRAAVIVSGGAAISPYTTPEITAGSGMAAGSTDTALREHLLAAGHYTFTSPAMIGSGQAAADPGFSGFSDLPVILPADLTVNSVGPIEQAGESLARFLEYLHAEFNVDTFDIVGHSMGGLFSRAAYRILRERRSPLRYRSLTTIGTPWQGAFVGDYADGELTLDTAGESAFTRAVMVEAKKFRDAESQGAGEEVTHAYLMGSDGWNARQAGVLDDVPVTLIVGDYFSQDGADDRVWPHDGLVSATSASARDLGPDVLPRRCVLTFPDVHSIYFTDLAGLPFERGLTWDPDVHDAVTDAIANAE